MDMWHVDNNTYYYYCVLYSLTISKDHMQINKHKSIVISNKLIRGSNTLTLEFYCNIKRISLYWSLGLNISKYIYLF